MSKKALGRGLGEMLPERGSGKSPSSTGGSSDPADLGPGLRVLVLQRDGIGAGMQTVRRLREEDRNLGTVTVSLGIADLALIALVLLWTREASRPFGTIETLGSIFALGLGGWFGCLAAWLHFRER